MNYLVLDLATAPLQNAVEFLSDEDFTAPENYGEEAAAKFIAKAKAKAIGQCALDPDLCRISGFGRAGNFHSPTLAFSDVDVACSTDPTATLSSTPEEQEAYFLKCVRMSLENGARLISYNGLKFDWPVLNARARYLGVKLTINLDRFKSPHVDLYAKLTNHGQLKGHSLSWWCKRLGWTDLCDKPLDGKDEARVFETGEWAKLAESLKRDVEATRRLAVWCGVLEETGVVASRTDTQEAQ